MRASIYCIFSLILCAALGCSSSDPSQRAGSNEHAQSLIDQGLYNEAINSLSEKVSQSPEDIEARVTLASALAGRAGISVLSFVPFAQTLVQGEEVRKALDLNELELFSWQIDYVFGAINALPDLTSSEQAEDIRRAIEVLDVFGLSTGAFLYRATLKLVIFKYNIMNSYRFEVNSSCHVRPSDLMTWFENVGGDLDNIMLDIGLSASTLEQMTKIQAAQQDIVRVNQRLQQVIRNNLDRPLVNMPRFFNKLYTGCA